MTPPLAGTLEQLIAEMRVHEGCSDSVSSPHCCVIERWADQLATALAEQPSPEHAWQPILTAPTGSGPHGPDDTRHPDYVTPPAVLLTLSDGHCCVGYWDWYYAEGGTGDDGCSSAWVEQVSGERVTPTYWMLLPPSMVL